MPTLVSCHCWIGVLSRRDQIYRGHPRFSDIPSPMRRFRAILTNKPCPKPEHLRQVLWDKVQQCWEVNAAKRPLIADFYIPLNGRTTPPCVGPSPYRWDGTIMSKIEPQPAAPLVAPYPALSTIPRVASPLPEGSRHRSRGIKYVLRYLVSRGVC